MQSPVFLGLPQAFLHLSDESKQRLAREANTHQLGRNEKLFRYGDIVNRIYVLRSGMLSLAYPISERESAVTEFFKAHDVVASALREPGPAVCEATSVGHCSAVSWPVAIFRSVMQREGNFGVWFAEQLHRRLEAHYTQRARLQALGLEERFAYFLWTIAEVNEHGVREVNVKIPQQVVASYLGVAREEISRKKQILEKAGYIRPTAQGMELSSMMPNLFQPTEGGLMPWED